MQTGTMTFTREVASRMKRAGQLALVVTVCACSGSGDADGAGGSGGNGSTVDITDAILENRSGDCADYVEQYAATVEDVNRGLIFEASLSVTEDSGSCRLTSNAVPNHDFNDGSEPFPNVFQEQTLALDIPRNPELADEPAVLTLTTYNGVMLNGTLIDVLAAACYGVGDEMIGCNDVSTPWRFDPMSPNNDFGTDTNNAHTQPDGTYHYHGNPVALFDDSPGSAGSPVVGFAADGFPIYGSYFFDGSTVRAAVSGYTLREGTRPDPPDGPGGTYDGTYIDDYEFTGAGDLDECNGMTVDGQYGYYVIDAYPWILRCHRGETDPSFDKGAAGAM
ncbi:MAG: YHYH protein [Myxococcota bacterium]